MIISVENVRCKTVHNAEGRRIEDLASTLGKLHSSQVKDPCQKRFPCNNPWHQDIRTSAKECVDGIIFPLPTFLAAAEWLVSGDELRCRWRIWSEALIIFGIHEWIAVLMKFTNIMDETGVSSIQRNLWMTWSKI
jgi:hypothetical protein